MLAITISSATNIIVPLILDWPSVKGLIKPSLILGLPLSSFSVKKDLVALTKFAANEPYGSFPLAPAANASVLFNNRSRKSIK